MKNILSKSLLGMAIFAIVFFTLNYFATETLEIISILSFIQCTLTVGVFIIVYNFYREWKYSNSQNKR